MTFTLGFGLGWLWGILTTMGAIGVGCALQDRKREWHDGMDVLLRRVSMEQRKRYNNAQVLDAVREVVRDQQETAWKN